MELETIIGSIASGVTIIYTSVGLCSQIVMNYRTGSASGLSLSMLMLMCLTFLSWVVYAALHDNYYVFIPNGLGFLFSLILIWQQRVQHDQTRKIS